MHAGNFDGSAGPWRIVITATVAIACVAVQGAADFNNDGFPDVAIGAPGKTVNAVTKAGLVMEVGCNAGGVYSGAVQIWDQDAGLLETCEEQDRFGEALAIGDFDGDGFSDLAVGTPYEDLGGEEDAGVVHVIYGGAGGLTSAANQLLAQDDAEEGDLFGIALATGDFDGDGHDDLAVGAPNEDIGAFNNAGDVLVYFGSGSGLDPADSQWIIQSYFDAHHQFGLSLAEGDFDDDGFSDLAIGAPGTVVDEVLSAGQVDVMWGSPAGLGERLGVSRWHQNSGGIMDYCETNDKFGSVLATGDFDGDGHEDLVVSAVYEDLATAVNAGTIHIIPGCPDGLTATGSQAFIQDSIAPNQSEDQDLFGAALAAGDFDGDGFEDLAVGTPFEDWGALENAGSIQLFAGTNSGLTPDYQITEDDLRNHAELQQGDLFGYALASGDLTGDGRAELIIGVPGEDWDGTEDAGIVHVTYGTLSGLSMSNESVTQCNPIYPGECADGDEFGRSVATVPMKTGSFGEIFSDGFESKNTSAWSSSTP